MLSAELDFPDYKKLICCEDQEFDEEGKIKTIMGCMYVTYLHHSGFRN